MPRSALAPAAVPGATSGGTTVSLGAPIENVSDPLIGCPSADTTRQVTTYVPAESSSGRSAVTISSLLVAEDSTGSPAASNTWIESSVRETASS